MIVALLTVVSAFYCFAWYRTRRKERPVAPRAVACFGLGLAVLAAALIGPIDDLSDVSLSWHMVQHLAIVSLAAPLLLLGAPVRLALSALPARHAARLARILASRALRFLTHPAFAWLQFSVVLYAAHFSALYEASLESEIVHAFEHSLFLGSALLFWTPVLAVAPAPHAPPHPIRLLSVFLALPMSAFLGFAFYVDRHVLYAHYAARPAALADQMNAGAVMWIAGGTPLFVTLLWVVADWGVRERRLGLLADGGR